MWWRCVWRLSGVGLYREGEVQSVEVAGLRSQANSVKECHISVGHARVYVATTMVWYTEYDIVHSSLTCTSLLYGTQTLNQYDIAYGIAL